MSLRIHVCLRVRTGVSGFSTWLFAGAYWYACTCLSVCMVCAWPVWAAGSACASVHLSSWVSAGGSYSVYVSACLWRSVSPVRLQTLWSLPGKPRMQSDAREWLGRPFAQTPSGSTTIFFQNEVFSVFQGPLLAAPTSSRPPGSPVSPFLMDLMSWGECLEVNWDFKMEIKKETSSLPPHSTHFPLLTFINSEHEAQRSQPLCIVKDLSPFFKS